MKHAHAIALVRQLLAVLEADAHEADAANDAPAPAQKPKQQRPGKGSPAAHEQAARALRKAGVYPRGSWRK